MKRLTDTVTLFWALAHWAISQGLLTEDQAHLIARSGTRKQGYWSRHLVDLCGVVGSGKQCSTPWAEGLRSEDEAMGTRKGVMEGQRDAESM